MTNRLFITTGDALPKWSNPVSHAVVANDMCFVSGQPSVNLAGQYVPGTVREESERAFQNFFAAIEAAGFSRQEIVFVDIAFSDLTWLDEVNILFMELLAAAKQLPPAGCSG